MRKKLRLVLGDQLNHSHSWFASKEANITYLIAELRQETDYVKHHIQKVASFFLAMEFFAAHLKSEGHNVIHLTLDDTKDFDDLGKLINSLVEKYDFHQFEYQRPDEHRLLIQLRSLALNVPKTEYDTEHFMLPFDEIKSHFEAGKHKKMEFFYRYMRRRYNILMNDDHPIGEKWNFDSENRNAMKKEDLLKVPKPKLFSNSAAQILKRISKHKVETFGNCSESIIWPVTREQALELLDYFCKNCLIRFGQFQDAMVTQSENLLGEQFWSLYHSRLSFALNAKLISPDEVIQTALKEYDQRKDKISLAQIEGFVRQILGWREFVRGIYWANMPDYATLNQLDANAPLPGYFWNAKTKMNCMHQAIKQSLDHAYAHHIQRLMITGNFALLAGLNPDQVDYWYLGVYIDAIEWVEMPNTRGMAIFADNSIVATKPYAASGNYINKMSDYCKGCQYNVKEKVGNSACPFNSLYWRFMAIHREKLSSNPRINMIYRNWDKQSDKQRKSVLNRANWLIKNIEHI